MSKGLDYEVKATDTSAVSDWTPSEVFTDIVQTEVRTNRVMDELTMTINDELVGSPGTSVRVRQRGTLTVSSATEGDEMGTGDVSANKVDVDATEHKDGLVVNITTEAEEDAYGDQFQDAVEELGEAGAESMDSKAYSEVLSASGSTGYVQNLSSAGDISYSDITELHADMRQGASGGKSRPDSIVISWDHLADLKTNDDRFTAVNKAGTAETLRDGMIGRFDGMKVYVTSQANQKSTSSGDVQCVLLDSDRAFAKAVKRKPTIKQDEDISKDSGEVAYTARFGYQVVDADAIGLLTNA